MQQLRVIVQLYLLMVKQVQEKLIQCQVNNNNISNNYLKTMNIKLLYKDQYNNYGGK
jgi:hypothetical protein